jgi:transcriptional regulator with XRE-family HTH domain
MNAKKRKLLEAAGWRLGDAADFLHMTQEERQLLDTRIELALAVRRQRESLKLSQKQLADRLQTSQPRVAKIERAARDVSLDQIVRAFAATGGRIVVKHVDVSNPMKARRATTRRVRMTSAGRVQGAEIQVQLIGEA